LLKHKAIDFLDVSRFWQGYVWTDSTSDSVSPSACYTEYVPPLPSCPQHLVEDAAIQASICALGDSIKVETPFDVDKFELLLVNHPNQLFIQSVMKGLQEGFWPFDEGDWKAKLEELPLDNYMTDPEDQEAIHAFWDRETMVGRWSDSLDDTKLPLGANISPMFIVWQNEKP